jgi:glutathione S-transferase
MAALEAAQRQDTAALRQEIADLGSAQRQDMATLESAQREDMAALRQEIVATNRRLDSHFRWLVGIQFGMVGLLVTILLKVL